MIGGGVSLMVFGVTATIISFLMQTSKDGYYNDGLLQNQQNILFIGLCLFVSGIILMSAGFIKESVDKQISQKKN